jgi:hypothetical protein
MARDRQVEIWTNTALVGALSNVVSGWIDIGKQTPSLEILRTNTGGTYAFEVDWSRDGGSTTETTDSITTVAGSFTAVTSKARWCRLRVRNTHATVAFSAHSTAVAKDTGSGTV